MVVISILVSPVDLCRPVVHAASISTTGDSTGRRTSDPLFSAQPHLTSRVWFFTTDNRTYHYYWAHGPFFGFEHRKRAFRPVRRKSVATEQELDRLEGHENVRAELTVLPAGAIVPARVSAPLSDELLAAIQENQENASAANTSRAYVSDWAAFERWCDENDQVALPASGATVAAYLTDRGSVVNKTGEYAYAPSTISRWLTSINVRHHADGHTLPGSLAEVKSTLSGIRRGHVRPTRRMAPLLLKDLKKVLAGIDTRSYPAGIIGHRDSAILVMGFAGAFRRSELASRRIGDVIMHSEDGLHVRLLTSKTDQEGRGSIKGLPFGDNPATCPPCVFLRWVRVLDAAANSPRSEMMRLLRESDTAVHICQQPTPELERLDPKDALFRPVRKGGHIGLDEISGQVINDLTKRRLTAVGMNAKRFGGHSLRAGFVTQALRSGATPQEVMRQTNHKSVSSVEIYRREHDPLRQNAVTRIGL
ncbi:site-specific integrase [Cryobacterium zhongshanensis]|uniref:Tyrosine-type recombinase/integrase n=1 Tax=Cryobacterium zhongshanensis TaxID=2928153 RepID=A0AA41QZD4_9MICO|nr:site-specific integrase [Cryobacterium zhongshanensis]MCI4659673.1 tyrosine-type recombinase/integrase [Cryobacterium zhongshanensis]